MGVLDVGGRGAWAAEGLTVEYSSKVITGICSSILDEPGSPPGDGLEIGGLLFGTRVGPVVRIEGFRPFTCAHAYGPEFVLSPADRTRFEKLIGTSRNEPDLKSLEAIGWYRSQRKGEIAFAEQDRDLHDRYFRYPSQIAVIFRTGLDGECATRIYAREANGAIRGCTREFRCPPLHPPVPAPAEQAVPEPAAGSPAPIESASRPPWKWLGPAALAVLLLAGALWMTWEYWFPQPQDTLALHALDMDGQLFIDWDRSARPIREGKSATLDIFDGSEKTSVPLNTAQLKQGNVSYTRKSDMVDLRMTIVRSRFSTSQEFLRFIGQPVVKRSAPREGEANLAQQVEQLKEQLRARDEELRRLRNR